MAIPRSLTRRSPFELRRSINLRNPLLRRTYAKRSSLMGTSTSTSRRKAITPFNDDGRVNWGDLSNGEKVARTTQTSFYSVLIGAGAIGFVAIVIYLYQDVFSTDSYTAHFNRAANRVRDDARCSELLGKSMEFRNTLEPARSRTFGSANRHRSMTTVSKDRFGTEWMHMRFYAAGEKAIGDVRLQMTKRPGEKEWSMHKLWMDVRGGGKRVVLEDVDAAKSEARKVPGKMFGVRWW